MRQIQENYSIEDEWFIKARFTICDAEDLLDKILTEVKREELKMGDSPGTGLIVMEKLRYKRKNIVRTVHPFKKTREAEMSEIIEKLEAIASQVTHHGLDKNVELAAIRQARGESTSSVNDTIKICGRSEDKKNIMKLLDSTGGVDDAFRVIPIVGMGGLGKTTLAALIFNECRSLSQTYFSPGLIPHKTQMDEDKSLPPPEFNVKVWVCLSDEFEVKDVIRKILELITGSKPQVTDLGPLEEELKKQLHGKKFLLVLDDFWDKEIGKWDKLRTPFLVGKPGSRIIVTTRSKVVAEKVTTDQGYYHQLNVMSKDESWSLFESVAFPDGSESASLKLKETGRRIVDRCEGLPLAIKMIGGLLHSNGNDVTEWNSLLNSNIWSSTSEILPSLWLSYYHLPQHVKQCFAYFSLFPKDYEFEMEEIVMLWVAEGFIERPPGNNEQFEVVARRYFRHLLSNFFIQESSSDKSFFVLHDLVHDLAGYVSRGLCVDWFEKNIRCRRLSYIQGEDEILLYKLKVQKLRRLRTFLPLMKWYRKPYLDEKTLSDMLANFKLLRVLSLAGYPISVLSDSVGDMKLLRYLDISHTYIECLPPRICRLYNLQFLNLYRCWKLKRLPMNIAALVNLRYLNVDDTDLKELPDGIGSMKNLQKLILCKLVLGKEKSSKQMKELKDLNNLHGNLQISGLHNITDKEHVVATQFGKKEYLEELVLDWEFIEERDTTMDESVLDAIQTHENLKKLTVSWYGGKRLSTWIVGMTPSSNIKLESFSIDNCFNLETLPPLGDLPALLNLTIMGSHRLKSLGEDFCGVSSNPFPALETLEVEVMKGLETWSFPGGGGRGFPLLKELRISGCPLLTSMPFCFPSLTVLEIRGCGNVFGSKMCSGGPSLGSLRHLKELIIKGLGGSEFLDEGFYGNDCCDAVFPALEKLEIRNMEVLTTWSVPGGNRQGFPSLKEIRIERCPELTKLPICFPSLTKLEIDGCHILFGPEMCGGPSLGNLPALKHLTISGLNCLESLNEGFYGDDCGNAPFFPALEKFDIRDMQELKTWLFPGGGRRRGFPLLKELRIGECPQLTKILFCYPCLTKLEIYECPNLIEIEMFGGEEGTVSTAYRHSLRSIKIRSCPKLEEIPKSFVNLMCVYCYDCDKLVSLPRLQNVKKVSLLDVSASLSLKAAIQDSTFLKKLEIWSRNGRDVAVELSSLDLNCLTSLKRLDLLILDDDYEGVGWDNDDQVGQMQPPNLSHLHISGCNLQMISKILTHFSNLDAPLTTLEFLCCNALESFRDVELPSTLRSLKITHCDALRTIPDRFLCGCSKSLLELTIGGCPNLVCLPPSISTFGSLQKLHLSECKALKSFRDVELPSTLQDLTIDGCRKLVCLPPSISTLQSLQKLFLDGCQTLKYLPDGFHNATALQTLTLRNCPNLVVPKEYGFPTALTRLTIKDCGKMKTVSKLKLWKLTSLTHLEL